MRPWIIWGAAVSAMVCVSSIARADDLSACLLKNTSQEDRTALVKWVFAAVSLNPAVKSLTSMSPAERDDLSGHAAGLLERLMTVDCRKETVYAIKYQGTHAIQEAFGVLGKVAMAGLMSDASVQSGLALDKHLDKQKFEQLGKEAAQLGK